VQQHIKMLHTQLHITAAEQPQWDQFAQVMLNNAQAMSTSLNDREAKLGAMNAVDSMSSYADLATQRAQDLVKLSTAFQTLYASFPAEQKQIADTLFQNQAEAHAAHDAKHKG
jgi:protein CpxP